MGNLVFNTRDEMISINVDSIAVVQANGNYSRIVSINRRETMVSMGITQVEEAIKNSKSKKSRFIRLSRSLVINHSYLYKIEILKQLMTLSNGVDDIKLKVSKETLKAYKNSVIKSIKIKNNEARTIRK